MLTRTMLFAAVAICAGAATAAAQTVGIAAGRQGFWTYSTGAAISKVAGDAGIAMRVQPFSGTSVYVPEVNSGGMQFGLANENETSFAVHGKVLYEGKPQPNLRVVAVIAPLTAALFVKKDSSIKTLKDLKGKRVTSGYGSQKVVELILNAFLENAGLTQNDIQPVPVPNVVRGSEDFAAGRADCFSFALGAGAVLKTDAAVGGVRALPIDPSKEGMAKMHKYLPAGYANLFKPRKGLVGVVEPVWLYSYDYLVLASTKTPDDMVYKLAKALHDNKSELEASFKPLADFQPDHMVKAWEGVEWHPGAVKYFKEIKQWPPKMGS
jgi:uncharacterized protein